MIRSDQNTSDLHLQEGNTDTSYVKVMIRNRGSQREMSSCFSLELIPHTAIMRQLYTCMLEGNV